MVVASTNAFSKEMAIRKRIANIYNKREENFPSLREYNDYLEEVEDMIFNLIEGIDVPAFEAKIAQYQRENAEQIMIAQARKAEEYAAALAASKGQPAQSDGDRELKVHRICRENDGVGGGEYFGISCSGEIYKTGSWMSFKGRIRRIFFARLASRGAILTSENLKKRNITYLGGVICVNVRAKKLIIFWCIVRWCQWVMPCIAVLADVGVEDKGHGGCFISSYVSCLEGEK
ncbi:hypothetical protein MTR67_020124 [Solanum verrucosum]|uniref:MAT1 centre domain-containing protein n=1 Tax=Solanum verrucosum TaxID=315347 RepID=A0AAF0TP61_SOLVR|nr:hypothetical protein MTR67_020124 [Solanum verrucosum]